MWKSKNLGGRSVRFGVLSGRDVTYVTFAYRIGAVNQSREGRISFTGFFCFCFFCFHYLGSRVQLIYQCHGCHLRFFLVLLDLTLLLFSFLLLSLSCHFFTLLTFWLPRDLMVSFYTLRVWAAISHPLPPLGIQTQSSSKNFFFLTLRMDPRPTRTFYAVVST